MHFSLIAVLGALVSSASSDDPGREGSGGNTGAKNFIYIVPDGYGVASQTLAQDYIAMVKRNSTVSHPSSPRIGADHLVRQPAFPLRFLISMTTTRVLTKSRPWR
jgi:alkaline phosphatase